MDNKKYGPPQGPPPPPIGFAPVQPPPYTAGPAYPPGPPQGPPPPPVGFAPSQPPPYPAGPAYPPGPSAPIVLVQSPALGPQSQRMICPHCNASISTKVELEPTTRTHIVALIVCLLFWPCVCLPYCADDCQGAKHYCPACQAYLGQYEN